MCYRLRFSPSRRELDAVHLAPRHQPLAAVAAVEVGSHVAAAMALELEALAVTLRFKAAPFPWAYAVDRTTFMPRRAAFPVSR